MLDTQRRDGLVGGTTAVVCLLDHESIYTANVGDSRALLYRRVRHSQPSSSSASNSAFEVIELTHDHRPVDIEERERIVGAGGQCGEDGYAMLDDHALAVSRALGNPMFKANQRLASHEQVIIANPHIHRINRSADDQFLLIASDGLWNYCDNRTACEFVARRLKKSPDLEEAARELVQFALDRRSTDNVTVVIVVFEWTSDDKTKHEKVLRSGKASFEPSVNCDSRSAALHSPSSRRVADSQARSGPHDEDTIRIASRQPSLTSLFSQ